MTSIANSIVPPILFFLAFFIAFTLIEFILLYIMKRLEKKYWEFIIDNLMRAKLHHQKVATLIGVFVIIIILGIILFATPILEVLQASRVHIKYFSLALIVAMTLVYFITTHKITKVAFERWVHGYIYFAISLIVFSFIVLMVDASYTSYKNYVNTQFVDPASQSIRQELGKAEESKLLKKFRSDFAEGKCNYIDYNEEPSGILKHFIYITTDPNLATVEVGEFPIFKGSKCSDGENDFLINEEGKWYWVIGE